MDAARNRAPGCTGAESPLPPPIRPTPGRYARFVGRVGALAVALGVGVAVATTYGMPAAHADDTARAADRSDDDPSDTGRTSGGTTSSGLPGKDKASEDDHDLGDDEGKDGRDDEPSAGIGRGSADDEPEDVFGSEAGHTVAESDLDAQEAETETGGDSEYDTDDISTEPTTTPPLTPDESAAPVPTTGSEPGADTGGNPPAAQDDPTPSTDGPLISGSGAVPGSAAIDTHSAVDSADSNDANNSADNPPNTIMTMNTSAAQQVSPLLATRPNVIEPERPNLIAGLLVIPGIALRLVATVAVALLSPFLAIGPSAPAQPLSLWALLGWVRREFERTLFNKTPQAIDDTSVSTAEDTPVTFSPVANDADPDADRVTVTDYTQPAHGTVSYDAATKQFSYTPDADFHGTDTFTYSVSDQAGFPHWHGFLGGLLDTGHRDTATVTITVTPVNDGPPATVDSTATVTEGGTATIDVLVGATDPDGDNTIDPTTVTIVTAPAHGTTTINPTTGVITYTHDGSETLTDTITYTIEDTTGATSAPATITITVTPVDDGAPIPLDSTATVTEGGTATIDVLVGATDPDGDNTIDPTTVTIVTAPAHGTTTINPTTGVITYTHDGSETLTDTITYTIDDTTGATSAPATITITITPANDGPPATVDSTATVTEGGTTTIDVLVGATDPDGDNTIDPTTVTIVTGPAHGTTTINPTTGVITYTHDGSETLTDTITYTVDDTTGATSAPATVTITITPVDDAPAIVSVTASTPNPATGAVTYIIVVTDADTPSGQLAIDLSEPANGTLSQPVSTVPGTYTVTYTPNPQARLDAYVTPGADVDTFQITISDNNTPVTVTVRDVPIAPAETAVLAVITTGARPQAVAISPDGTRAYVANWQGNSVTVIDTATGTVIATVAVETGPNAVAISPDGTRAYIANFSSNNVAVIDTSTNTVIGSIETPSNASGVAFSPDGTRAYISYGGYYTGVSIVDTATNTVITTHSTGGNPKSVAVSPDGTRVYVSNGYGYVSIFDTTTNALITHLTVGNSSNITPISVAVSPDGTRAYVTLNTWGTGMVAVIDTATNTVIDTDPDQPGSQNIVVGTGPRGVAFSPDGTRAYVANLNSRSISIIDTATYTVLANVDVAVSATAVAVSPDGSKLYVTDGGGDTVTVLGLANRAPVVTAPPTVGTAAPDTGAVDGNLNVSDIDTLTYTLTTPPAKGTVVIHADGTFTYTPAPQSRLDAYTTPGPDVDSFSVAVSDGRHIPVTVTVEDIPIAAAETLVLAVVTTGSSPYHVAVSPDGTRAYISNFGSDTVTVIDAATNAVVATISVGLAPEGVAISPDGELVYVAIDRSNSVTVIDTATNTVIGSIGVVDRAGSVAFSPDGTRAYVGQSGFWSGISFVDTATDTVISSHEIGGVVTGVAVSPDGSRVYVSNGQRYLSVFDAQTAEHITDIRIGRASAVPVSVAISPDGTRAYILLYSLGTSMVGVIDLVTNTVIDVDPDQPDSQNILVGVGSRGLALSPDGTRAYAANGGAKTVSIIDTATYTVLADVEVGVTARGVAVSPDGSRLYITDEDGGTVTVLGLSGNL